MATYLIQRVADSKYTNVVEWDGNTATWQPPTGSVAALATPTTRIQADADIAAARSADLAAAQTSLRDAASNFIQNDPTPTMKCVRADALATLDAVNALREWVASFKVAVAASTSLANLQVRVAALPDMPDITPAQMLNAVVNKIASGAAD